MERPSPNQEPKTLRDSDYVAPVERLEAARPNLEQLVTTMAPDIKAGRWDMLLGDDVSARIPTLILRGVIARSYADQGLPAPQTRFVAMGQEFSEMDADNPSEDDAARLNNVKNYLASGDKPKRVLFITDNINGGSSIKRVLETLDELSIPSDVASVQESKSTVEYSGGHVAYSPEEATKIADNRAAQHPFYSEAERESFIEAWTHGFRHGERDPDAKYYGVEEPINTHQVSQPFHLSKYGRPRGRAAVGVEQFGDSPTTEGQRHHAIRELNDGELKPDERVPSNPDEAALRQAAAAMAESLYNELIVGDQKEA